MLPAWVDRVARHAYTLCLVLAAVTLGLAPLHGLGVHHANVDRLRPDTHAELLATPGHGLAVGDPLPVYRFNPGWMQPIGHGEVAAVAGDRVVVALDPATFRWQPGRQGTVTGQDGSTLTVNVGSELNLEPGARMTLFDEREPLGTATLTTVSEGRSVAELDTPVARDLVGVSATNFQVVDQVAWFDAPLIAAVEVGVLVLALLAWAASLVDPRPGAWVARSTAHVRRAWPRSDAARVIQQALLGVPVIYLSGQVLWYSTTRVVHLISIELYFLDVLPDLGLPEFTSTGLPVIWALGALGWYGWLARTRRSPALALWHALRWRPLPFSLPVPRGAVLWVLHLVIAYAFASTLYGFLRGNLAVLTDQWPPHDLETFFSTARYTLWSVTICGCLFGYGHTVLSILWRRDAIQHMDFTPLGWFTNALCYYPLLGAALLHAFPPLHGHDPLVVGGPLSMLQPVTELLLNLCYTLSIWNLGKMFGVMVDKGVRTTGFYSVVRHPSYTLEALMFMVMYLTGASTVLQWVAAGSYLLKYWLRSEREDQFMSAANPDYTPYRERVGHKFVPGVL